MAVRVTEIEEVPEPAPSDGVPVRRVRRDLDKGSFDHTIGVMRRIERALAALDPETRATVLNFFLTKNRLAPPF